MGRVVIWDLDAPPPRDADLCVLWRQFAPPGDWSGVSLPDLVEEHSMALRARYLAWIHELGQTVTRGRPLVDHFRIRPQFSYWWSAEIAQNANYTDAPWITDVIKCLALEAYVLSDLSGTSVEIQTARPELAEVLSAWCHRRGVPCVTPAAPPPAVPPAQGPQPVGRVSKIIEALRHAMRSKRAQAPPTRLVENGLCFFDIFVYLTPESLRSGRFGSQYWGALPEACEDARTPVHWVHVFYPHADIPTLADATATVDRFNVSGGALARHLLLEEASGRRALLRGVRDFVKLVRIERGVRSAAAGFTPAWTTFHFWPLIRRSWARSFRSPTVLRDCVRLAQFEDLLGMLPRQATGVFIQENQPWELALMYAWRHAGHGTLVGTPHTTVRFWDLRYFRDPRTWADTGPITFPVPDRVAVNGPMAAGAFRDSGYDTTQLVEVEALRFDHLLKPANRPTASAAGASSLARRILICGDNIPLSNERLLASVGIASHQVPASTTWVFKPHKARPCNPTALAGVAIPVDDRPLADLLGECDLVVTGNTTSAAADAYFRGRSVAVLRDGAKLNGSPVRGLPGVRTFSNGEELMRIVLAPIEARASGAALFTLDAALPRWRALLGGRAASSVSD